MPSSGPSAAQFKMLRAVIGYGDPYRDVQGAMQLNAAKRTAKSLVDLRLIEFSDGHWCATSRGHHVHDEVKAGRKPRLVGEIRAVTEWVVSCALCSDEVGLSGGAGDKKMAEAEADALGWRVVGSFGRVCPKCAMSAPVSQRIREG